MSNPLADDKRDNFYTWPLMMSLKSNVYLISWCASGLVIHEAHDWLTVHFHSHMFSLFQLRSPLKLKLPFDGNWNLFLHFPHLWISMAFLPPVNIVLSSLNAYSTHTIRSNQRESSVCNKFKISSYSVSYAEFAWAILWFKAPIFISIQLLICITHRRLSY